MSEHVASCSCGGLSIRATGAPLRVSVCHCLACQKRTGSVFAVQARFPVEATTVEGASSVFVRTGDEGSVARFHFCPSCGATVYYLFDSQPEVVAIPVGGFADPHFPAPTVSGHEARMHRWIRMAEEMEHFH